MYSDTDLDSVIDDLTKDPTVTHKIKSNPSTPKATRAVKKSLVAAKADPTAVGQNIVKGGATSKGGATPIKMDEETVEVLRKLGENIESMTVQNKQNNNAFVGELPYFGIPKDADNKKSIIPINEVSNFIRIVDTQTDKNNFTAAGKIAIFKRQLLGAARDHWSKYDGDPS